MRDDKSVTNLLIHFCKSINIQTLGLLLMSCCLVFEFVNADESKVSSCEELIENSTLYEACLQNNKISNFEISDPDSEENESGIEPCYCDIRKQKQVEIRLKRIEKQNREKEGDIAGMDGE